MRMYNPPHPGEILAEYLNGRPVTATSTHLGVSRVALSRVLNGRAGISADMAIRLAEAFNTTPELWMNLQVQYDLARAGKARRKKITPLHDAA
ncbi:MULTISPECIES: HigA family addiction module antitoxin [Acidobacterium]|uniref:Addiction module antidote protein, HigA family n=1 Tax=Acidobacterium capsulatum (strain ATCC 51196 / DSM 11244 / BCRC 80197 / JCM 7670 / NBRC 15755 / NCIMB 13165 / 161) TaxID=240015 RepID=C1F9P8_ACIC5|nr:MULTISPECIES: HigA family addiction module antitoxin [Acidobacterium]ACO32479.1 addiction module antidote protein, HigA family [Acidobacterium capsulatum ATCC 51196]HCT62252.1 addiction module antidote protein, HigA family [Acidobacterium sp.]